ncbi:MAG: hypothetical protein QG622_2135 [Actinomycetota bacterium]|nr:hypothetical protein [Actinomycetota bacterium]
MSENLLDGPQIRAAVEKMGRRRMPQPVRADGGSSVYVIHQIVHDLTNLTNPHPTAPDPEEHRGSGPRPRQNRAASGNPGL